MESVENCQSPTHFPDADSDGENQQNASNQLFQRSHQEDFTTPKKRPQRLINKYVDETVSPALKKGKTLPTKEAKLETDTESDGTVSEGEDEIKSSEETPVKTEADYEQQRLNRIKENFSVLNNLGISSARSETSALASQFTSTKSTLRRVKISKSKAKSKTRTLYHDGLRRSSRLCKDTTETYFSAKTITSVKEDSASEADGKSETESDSGIDYAFAATLEDRLYKCEEYFELKKLFKPEAIKYNVQLIQDKGMFSGWVEESLRKELGIETDALSAWENNQVSGLTVKSSKKTKARTVQYAESAKEVARKMLLKNPNSYFYRHCAPGIEQWGGDWTEEENEMFLETAKRFGVGNKWGLFATYIPHRVGYQCSNHYRAHFIGNGIVYDDNFRFTKFGETVYVGFKQKAY